MDSPRRLKDLVPETAIDLDELPSVDVVIYRAVRLATGDTARPDTLLEIGLDVENPPGAREHSIVYRSHSPHVERVLGLLGIKVGAGDVEFRPPILARLSRSKGLPVLQ